MQDAINIILILTCIVWLIYISKCIKISRIKKIIGQIFCLEWITIILLSRCNLYNINTVSVKVILCVFVHIFSFMLGYTLNFKVTPSSGKDVINVNIFHNVFINIIAWLALVPLSIVFSRYRAYASLVGTGTARGAIFSVGEIFHTVAECQLYLYFGYTYFFVFSAILIYGIFTREMFKSWLFFPVIIGVTLYLITGAGRLDYIVLGCEALVISLTQGEKKSTKWQKQKVILGILGLICAIIIVTGKRFGIDKIKTTNIKELFSLAFSQLYIYTVGPLRALDYALENYVSILGYNFGRMTFGAIDEVIGWEATAFGVPYEIMNFNYGGITQKTIFIGKGQGFNALYTALFHFYFDFGWMGIVLFSFVFGALLSYFIKKVDMCCSIPNIIILCEMFFTMLMLPISWKMSAPAMLIIIGICVCWDRVRIRI